MRRLNGHNYLTDPNEDLGEGTWTREQLEAMDALFVAALEKAFALGLESRASAAGQIKLPASSGPRRSTPLCPAVWDALAVYRRFPRLPAMRYAPVLLLGGA
jgi:hypothetical protein